MVFAQKLRKKVMFIKAIDHNNYGRNTLQCLSGDNMCSNNDNHIGVNIM